MGRDPWYESDSPTRFMWGFWRNVIVIILATAALVAAVWVGAWYFRVHTSETKGAGDAQIQINSGKNQIASQELLEKMYANVLEYDRNLDVMAAAVKRDPSAFNTTNYDGLLMTCNAAVAEYNAETRKISSEKWRSKDLPYEIDSTNPLTDCKETAR